MSMNIPKFPVEYFGDTSPRKDLSPPTLKKTYVRRKSSAGWSVDRRAWGTPSSPVCAPVSLNTIPHDVVNSVSLSSEDTIEMSPSTDTYSPYATHIEATTPPTSRKKPKSTLSPLEKFEITRTEQSHRKRRRSKKQHALSINATDRKKKRGKATRKGRKGAREHRRILKNKEEELRIKHMIEQDAWDVAQERAVKKWESMWAGDLAKVIRLGPEVRIEEGFYDTLVSKTISIQRVWRMFSFQRRTTQKFLYLVDLRREQERSCATYIQCWYRAVRGWRYMQLLVYRRNTRMATAIQRMYRGHLGREKCKRRRKKRLQEWIRETTGVKTTSRVPLAKSFGAAYGGVTYREKLDLINLSTVCFRPTTILKYRNLESAEASVKSISRKVMQRRANSKVRKDVSWNLTKGCLAKAMATRLDRHELGVRSKIEAEREFVHALRAQKQRESEEREKMNAEWEHFLAMKHAKEARAEQGRRKGLLAEGLKNAEEKYNNKMQEENRKELEKRKYNQSRVDKVNSIRLHRGMYLSAGRNTSDNSVHRRSAAMYIIPHDYLPNSIYTRGNSGTPDSPRYQQRKKTFHAISSAETIRISSYTIHKALDQLRRHWRVSQIARQRLDVPPRFLGRNRAIQQLSMRIDTETVARTLSASTLERALKKTKIKVYTKKLIRKNLNKCMTSVFAKSLLAEVIPYAVFSCQVRILTKEIIQRFKRDMSIVAKHTVTNVMGTVLRNIEGRYLHKLAEGKDGSEEK